MFSTLKRTVSALLVASIAFSLVGTAVAAPPTNEFTAAISPATANAGETKAYTFTITNSGTGGKIKSASVAIPAGFSVTTVTMTSPSGWTVSTTTTVGTIRLEKSAGSDLDVGNSAVFTFNATAPGTSGVKTWTTTAYSGTNLGGTAFTLTSANPTVTVSGEVIPTTFTLLYTAGVNGSLTGSTTQVLASSEDGTAVTAVADSGYHFVDWSDATTTNPRTDLDVSGNVTVTANFAADVVVPTLYTLTYLAGTNGSLTGSTTQVLASGDNGTAVTATADLGYHFVNWSDLSTQNPRTDISVTGNVTVTANFAADQTEGTTTYTLSYAAGANGTLSGTAFQTVDEGTDGTAVTAVADSGYHFVDWSDASTNNPRTDTGVMADVSVTANFAIDAETPPVVVEQIGGAGGTNGTPGCKDSTATNYDPTAVYEGTCTYATTTPAGEVLGAASSTAPVGEVLGASTSTLSCSEYLALNAGLTKKALREGAKNDSTLVTLLQRFLNEFAPANLPTTGFFGPMTTAAVKKLQAAHADTILAPWKISTPTGIVYVTTVAFINNTKCPTLNIKVDEKDLVPASR